MEGTKIQAVEAHQQEKPARNPVMRRLRVALLLMSMVAMLALPASAEGADASSLLTSTGTVVTSGISIVWSIITGNPILSAIAGMSVLSIAFYALGRAKHAARF